MKEFMNPISKIIMLVFLITVLYGSKCKNDCTENIELIIPVTIDSQNDTILIGDTIRIEFDFGKNLKDLISVKDFEINGNITLSTELIEISGKKFIYGLERFRYYNDGGTVSKNCFSNDTNIALGTSCELEISLFKQNEFYKCVLFLIPKQSGLYFWETIFVSFLNKEVEINNECTGTEKFVIRTNNPDGNYDMFQTSPIPDTKKFSFQEYRDGGGYTFYVK